MEKRTCFVIMAIGDQQSIDYNVTAADLRRRYDDLIKEALLRADPALDVTRADDVALPGTITSDILTRIMHSDLVIADVTYPNPNVFYELGLRHACRAGTVIIRDESGPKAPFDISHLRYIGYSNTPSGLKALEQNFRRYFEHFARDPQRPDNHLLELAKLTKFSFPKYEEPEQETPEVEAIMAMLRSPQLLDVFARQGAGEEVDQGEIIKAFASSPDIAGIFAKALVQSGQISFFGDKSAPAASPSSAKPKKGFVSPKGKANNKMRRR